MGFMDELKKLTQPYDEEDDFFEDSAKPVTPVEAPPSVSSAQMQFESAFGAESASAPEPASRPVKPAGESGGFFGGIGGKRQSAPPKQKTVSFGGSETQVFLFNPKSFEEAGELVGHLQQGRSIVMTLEGVPTDNARRLLDFLSGIAFALQGKITPVSAKTYFVTPQNVDIVGAQPEQPLNDGQYF